MRKLIAAITVLSVFLLAGYRVSGQESATDAKSAIAELNRFQGTWEKQFTIYKSEWSPVEQTKSGTQTDAWILDDHHLQETGQDSDGQNFMTVYSYDVAAKAYRASVFLSDGDSWQMTGQWDAQSSTLTWKREVGDGILMTGTCTFLTPDQFKFGWIAKGKDNKELFRLEGTGTRRDAKKQ